MHSLDNIVIGTSPISMAQAIFLKKSNKDVSIIEKRSDVGGCWQIRNYEDMQYDLGCHFLVPFDSDDDNNKVIEILKRLGITADFKKTFGLL